MSRRRCLPVAPSAERIEVIHVRYCTGEGTEAEPASSPPVPPVETFLTCPTCGGSGEIEAKETAA